MKKDEGAKDKLAIPAVLEKTDYNEDNEEEEQDPILELLESIDTRLTGIIEKMQEATSDGAQEYQMLSPATRARSARGSSTRRTSRWPRTRTSRSGGRTTTTRTS